MPRLSRLLCWYSSSFVACSNWCVASADCGSLLLGVELHDLVVALHASQRCLSKVAFDCTSKMAHFSSERVACSSSVSREKKRSQREGGAISCVIFLALLNLAGSLWMVLIRSLLKLWVRELILLPSPLALSFTFLAFFSLSLILDRLWYRAAKWPPWLSESVKGVGSRKGPGNPSSP